MENNTPPDPVTVNSVPETTKTPLMKKNLVGKHNRFTTGILVGLLIAAIFVSICAGMFMYTKYANPTLTTYNSTPVTYTTTVPTVTAKVVPTTVVVTTKAANSNTYTNSKFGFEVTIPSSWTNKYKANEQNNSFQLDNMTYQGKVTFMDTKTNAEAPTGAEIYTIYVMAISDWNKNSDSGLSPYLITKSTKYAFIWSYPQTPPYNNSILDQEITTMINDGKSMISSFKLI